MKVWKNFMQPKRLLHVVLLALGLVFTGLILDFKCILCENNKGSNFQFINSTAGGFTVIMFIIFIGIFFSEDLERSTQLSVSYMAAIFHAVSMWSFGVECSNDPKDVRMLIATVLCGILAVIHLVEAIFLSCIVQRISQ